MEAKPASELSAEQLAVLFNEAFKDYFSLTINFTPETLTTWLTDSSISLPLSHVFFNPSDRNEPIAFILIATRPDKPHVARVGAMGVVPGFAGRGIGSRALATVIEAERARGTSMLELEVIHKNEAALKMYNRAGFTITHELLGWQRDAPAPGEFEADGDLRSCSVEEVDNLVKKYGADDLPWQAWEFKKSTETQRAFRLGDAYCVVSDPEDEKAGTIHLRSLIVVPGSRSQGHAIKLVKAMLGKFSGKKWVALAHFPKELCKPIAEKFGFETMEISQYQMRLTLQ